MRNQIKLPNISFEIPTGTNRWHSWLHPCFFFQGLVLGCFFWGYPVFQIAGGYLSDKIGGEHVMYRAAAIWGLVTVLTPHIAYMYPTKQASVYSMALLRFLMGLSQGKFKGQLDHCFMQIKKTSLVAKIYMSQNSAWSTDKKRRFQNPNTTQCNGIVSHGAPVGDI